MSALRVGVVGRTGRGDYGHNLDLAFCGVAGTAVVAMADEDAAGRRRAASRTGAANTYDDYREMLERESLDIVVVAPRWVDCHEEMVLAAISSGAHVLCEKPFLRTLTEADRVLAAAQRAGVRIAVAHQARAFPIVGQIQELLDSGVLGQLRWVHAVGKSDRRGGGDDLALLGPHLFDLMRAFVGEAAWLHAHVTANGSDIGRGDIHEGEDGAGPVAGDAVFSYIAYHDGAAGRYDSSVLFTQPGPSYLSLMLYCTEGIISMRSIGDQFVYRYPQPVILPGDHSALPAAPAPSPTAPAPSLTWERIVPADPAPPDVPVLAYGNRLLAEDLVAAIRDGREPLCNGSDAAATLELVMAIYSAQRAGTRVPLPLRDRRHPLAVWGGDGVPEGAH